MLDEFLQKKKEFDDYKKQFEEDVKQTHIGPLFEEFFKRFPEVPAIYILGWTPGFNDGDPCTHSSEVFMDIDKCLGWNIWYGEPVEEIIEDAVRTIFQVESGVQKGEVPEGHNGPNLKEAYDVAHQLEEIFEARNGTNYEVSITKNKDGTVEVVEGHYDCGY